MIFLVLILNALRFVGLSISPPGFYVDEAAGATQVLCLEQTGHDFFNEHWPLFSHGLGGGFYTAPFLYGEMIWTSIFGNSPQVFRAFLGLVTCFTIYFLYSWVRRRGGERAALFTALSASIMPWAFQFSRIAWDPPLAVLFLVIALWASSGKKMNPFAGVFLALAAYSYPPMRVGAALFWILIPGRTWKQTFRDLGVFAVVCIPLFLRSMDPDFVARGKMLAIWSSYSTNPYANANIFQLLGGFISQVCEHFSFDFLFLKGDANLRHSIQSMGMLSWMDGLSILGGIYFLLRMILPSKIREKLRLGKNIPWSNGQIELLMVAILGILIGVTPAALTWEGVPHALRAIGAWPFFAVISGLMFAQLEKSIPDGTLRKCVSPALGLFAMCFFAIYLNDYFGAYAERAVPWFQTDNAPISQAYHRMTVEGKSCAELRRMGH